jgi:acyl-coenzyme A thioesterase PaaI-like protein
MCFVCGRENPIGFHMQFYADEENRVHADYTPHEAQQGYPGVLHGGLVTALLDEVIGFAGIASNVWCMTAKLDVRFRKPIPVNARLHVMGEITSHKRNLVEGHSEIRLGDGSVAAEARGTFLRIPEAQLKNYKQALAMWQVEEK